MGLGKEPAPNRRREPAKSQHIRWHSLRKMSSQHY